jgi:hypothetical protein
VPVLPLGNVSLGLAVAYVPLAVAWLVLFARDARSGLLFVAGPFLALVHLLPLMAVVALRARGPVRSTAVALAGVLAAAGTAIAAGSGLPLTGEEPPGTTALRGIEGPAAAVDAAAGLLTSRPTMIVLALAVAAATAAARPARKHGLWGVAGWGAGLIGALLLAPLAVGGEPVAAAWAVPAAWLAAGALAYPLLRERR